MLKTIKLKKSDYKDVENLLKRAGLVDLEENRAYPENLFISKQDLKKFKKEITSAFKKKYPFLHGTRLKSAVGMYWLNLGPSEAAVEAVRPGFALVLKRKQ